MRTSFLKNLLAITAIILPGLALAQVVKGYTDAQAVLLPGGDTRIELKSDGTTTTLRLQNLYAYGEAGMKLEENGKREAAYASNPGYFRGSTVYAMRNSMDEWCGARTAASVLAAIKDKSKKCGAVIGQAKIGNNDLGMSFPALKASGNDAQGRPIQWMCQTGSFVGEKADGKAFWLGHPGWAETNTDAGIGDYMVLANNDKRFPATAFCHDREGKILKLTPEMRAYLAKVIKAPAGSEVATAKAGEQ